MDRNFNTMQIEIVKMKSLSARRAWIEMVTRYIPTPKPVVALRKESVDRNVSTKIDMDNNSGRSPQGERG